MENRASPVLYEIRLSDFLLERVAVDYSLELSFQTIDRFVLIRFPKGTAKTGARIDAGCPQSIIPLLELLHVEGSSVVADKDGGLRIIFVTGAEIYVSPNPEFEAWEFVTSESTRWICTPGGDVVSWSQ